jgi:epoxyqueuosine reductase
MADNLTRREFLKDLGLLGAGVTLAPAALTESSLFEAWDHEKTPALARPAWIKTQDKPTMEINWEQVQRYDERNTCRGGFPKYVGQDRANELVKLQNDNLAKWLKEGKTGYSLKDVALQAASGSGSGPQSFLGPSKDTVTPEKRGVAKWTGTPEDAARMVTSALRHLGAATVGFLELDTNTTEKLIYSVDPDGKEMQIADVDQPSEDDKKRVIPKKARWVVTYTVQMSEETLKRAPTILGAQTTNLTYTRNRNIQFRLQTFLQSLGYMALGESATNALGIAPAFAVMAGLGEESRLNRLITPEYGPMARTFKLITDLPLAPTKPINAGIMEFCKYCKTCAEVCPSKALSFDTEPTWQVRGGWNNPGHKAFFEDSTKCRSYWYEIGTNCGTCFAVCPFGGKDKALVHQITKALISTTPVLDPPLKAMRDLAYGVPKADGTPPKDVESWWKLDLPEYGINTTQGHRDV